MKSPRDPETQRRKIPIPEGDHDLCRALWLSVLVQAVVDAKSQRSRPCFKRHQTHALDWINGVTDEEEKNFIEVCDLAGVDPVEMRQMIENALESNSDNFNFRCLMKHAKVLRRDRQSRQPFSPEQQNPDTEKFMQKARELSIEVISKQGNETIH